MFRRGLIGFAALVLLAAASPVSGAQPEQDAGPPRPSDWTPDYTVFPYDIWQSRVTPEQVTALRESCQWFNAEYQNLVGQAFGFQHFLGEQRDDWTATGVGEAANIVTTNLDRSAEFLHPRADTLFIVNYPDQSEYSPLFHGDSIYRLWYQLTQISDKISRRVPSGQINANTATLNVYGTVIRDSGVCEGA